MYRSLASEAGQEILELACGTGIVAIELARAGSHVTGLDISADMLQVARGKVLREDAEVQARIRLVEGDMKDFKLGRTFDGIFLTNNSYGYLTAPLDRRSCMQAIHDHLRPGGLMAIKERNYTPEVLMRTLQGQLNVRMQMGRANPATGKYTMHNWMTVHIDSVTQTITSRSFIDEIQSDGTVKRYVRGDGISRNHYYNRFELQLLIEQAGFAVRDVWGGYVRQPLGPRSYSMIFAAQKR